MDPPQLRQLCSSSICLGGDDIVAFSVVQVNGVVDSTRDIAVVTTCTFELSESMAMGTAIVFNESINAVLSINCVIYMLSLIKYFRELPIKVL